MSQQYEICPEIEHMLQDRLETVQLFARFKLSVRRHLQISVDLQLLQTDRNYAERVLAAIEAAAEDEQLLILTLQVRDSVLPVAVVVPPVATIARTAHEATSGLPVTSQTRSYMFGARGF
jgi:hypothetical protein